MEATISQRLELNIEIHVLADPGINPDLFLLLKLDC